MKRLAVSVLFILIAATFAADAAGALQKLRSWVGRGCERQAVHAWNQITSPNSAPMNAGQGGDERGLTIIRLDGDLVLLSQNCGTASQPCLVGTISSDGKTITLNSPNVPNSREGNMQGLVFKLVGSDSHADRFEFITTAARQIRGVLELIRIK